MRGLKVCDVNDSQLLPHIYQVINDVLLKQNPFLNLNDSSTTLIPINTELLVKPSKNVLLFYTKLKKKLTFKQIFCVFGQFRYE